MSDARRPTAPFRAVLAGIGAVSGVAALLGAAAWARLHDEPRVVVRREVSLPAPPPEPLVDSIARPTAQPSDPAVPRSEHGALAGRADVESPSTRESTLPDDESILATLHELAASDPARSLRLARAALERSPASPAAPEFAWNAVKALYNMGNVDEAIGEARQMVRTYPDSDFSADVSRHLLYPQPNP
jgi:hypothetical protein